MIDVCLSYGRRSKDIAIPETWSEVEAWDAPRILSWACGLPESMALSLLLQHYIPPRYYKRLEGESLMDIIHLLQWFRVGPSAEPYIASFDLEDKTYYMPTPRFMNGQAMEWPLADEFYQGILDHQDDADRSRHFMLMLAATLYRELDKGKRNPLLGRADVTDRALLFEQIDDIYLLNALYYFAGCKIDLAQIYGHTIFRTVETDDEGDSGSEAYFGWWGIYMDIAEAGLFGNLDQVHLTNFHTICMYLSKKYLEAEDRKQQEMFNTPDHD